jgi:hypothetical protein
LTGQILERSPGTSWSDLNQVLRYEVPGFGS